NQQEKKPTCYTENSGNETNSSDLEYTKKLKRQQKSRLKQKANYDNTFRSNIIISSLNENIPSPA
ncbi:3770_t:CDS:2, partial [Funneliformis geosporum]